MKLFLNFTRRHLITHTNWTCKPIKIMQLTAILCLLATAGECDEDPFTSDEGKMNVQTVTSMIRKFITHLIFGMPGGGYSLI